MRHPFLLAVCVAAAILANAAEAKIILVDAGSPKAVIVIGANPSEQAREAAQTLCDYLERISGGRLEIRASADNSQPRIFVGDCEEVHALGIEPLSRRTNEMSEERFIVKSFGQDLVLAGNEHPPYRGTAFAVYELLERLGCRWYFPGAFGEVVPKSATIVLDTIDLDERPDFRFRNIWYSGWMPATPQDSTDLAVWRDRNKMNGLEGMSLPGDDTVKRLAPAEKYFETLPQIYAINKKGERDKDMLCLTEPEAVRVATQTICEAFRADPNMSTFGFGPPDGSPMCYCERCQASNPEFYGKGYGEPSLSDVWFRFANAVASEVYKEFPDRWLLTNGYANRVRPPEGVGPLSPNLGIQFAMLDTCTFHAVGDPKCWQRQAYKTVFDRWTRDLRCLFIYDYDPGKALDGIPAPGLHCLMHDVLYFKDHGVWGFWTEGQNCWMVTHLNYYVRAKLMWNAHADVRAIVRDYASRFYGKAGNAIEDYVWKLEDAVEHAPIHETFGRLVPWRVIYTPKVMRKLDRLMLRAERETATSPELARVEVLRLVHKYIHAYLAMEASAAEGDFATAAQHAGTMMDVRTGLCRINPSLIPVTPEWCSHGDGAVEWHREVYQGLADRMNGTKGALVAMTPREWEFRYDPHDMGVLEQWYDAPSLPAWSMLDTTMYWEAQGLQDAQGYGLTGKAWYRASFPVDASAANKNITLTIGGLYSDRVWVWVNGFLVYHRFRQNTKVPFDIDVTGHVKPGEVNRVAIALETLKPDRNARGGLHRRVFLWSPK